MGKLTTQAEKAAALLLKAVEGEVSGGVDVNGHRLAKGKHLSDLERIGTQMRSSGEDLGDVTPLQFAKAKVEHAMFDRGIRDTHLDDAEVSIVRKAYRAVEPKGGLEAEFDDVLAIHPLTGDPLVNDGGKPIRRRATEVPVNRIYYVADYAEQDFSTAMSFANRMSERGLRTFSRLAKRCTGKRVIEEMKTVVGMDGPVLSAYVAEQLGIPDKGEPQFKNITVPIEVFEDMYEPARKAASLIMGFLGIEEVLDEEGLVQPGIFMRAVLDLLDPHTHGPWRVLELLTRHGSITPEQAAQFKVSWEEDGLADRWDEVSGNKSSGFPEVERDVVDEVLEEVERTPF